MSSRRNSAFALAEALIAMAVIALVASTSLYSIFAANRHVARQRLVSAAKALCQERIDEALTQPLSLSKVPLIYGSAWPLPTVETQTSNETVPLYVSEENAADTLVTGTRKTWVTGYVPTPANPSFCFARIRVRVEFWFQGRGLQNRKSTDQGAQPFFYEMTTLRSPD